MEHHSSFPLLFFGLLWLWCLFCVLRPQPVVDFTVKYFKWSIKLYGFEGDVKPTPRAVTIVRMWNSFGLTVLSILLFLAFTGKMQ